jgi:hypothetical protein
MVFHVDVALDLMSTIEMDSVDRGRRGAWSALCEHLSIAVCL